MFDEDIVRLKLQVVTPSFDVMFYSFFFFWYFRSELVEVYLEDRSQHYMIVSGDL
jgi:hypothetical protein